MAATDLRPELRAAQRGEGPFATPVIPEPGERVIQVPQAASFLVSIWDGDSVLGLPVSAIERHLSPRYGSPGWHTYDPRHDPEWGYALLVVRDGLLYAGPQQWDSGD